MKKLTKHQIKRQDLVDNAIYRFSQTINPSLDKEIDWDIEMIGDIRDVIKEWLVDKLGSLEEKDFYPYLEE